MPSRFPLHRPELLDTLREGDRQLDHAMGPRTVLFDAGSVCHANGESRFVYRLRTGWMVRTRTTEDGRSQIVAVFLPGDLVGVKSLTMARQPDVVQCLTPATASSISHDRLRLLLETSAAIALRLLFQLGEDERRLHTWLMGLGRGSAEERLASLLIDLRGRLYPLGLVQNDTFKMAMSQRQMADQLGLTVVHVNRVLRLLREAGVVTMKAGAVEIHDLARLHSIARPLLDVFEREAPEFGAPERRAPPSMPSLAPGLGNRAEIPADAIDG